MILSLMSVLVAGCGDDKYVQSLTYSPCLNAGDSWIQTILAY